MGIIGGCIRLSDLVSFHTGENSNIDIKYVSFFILLSYNKNPYRMFFFLCLRVCVCVCHKLFLVSQFCLLTFETVIAAFMWYWCWGWTQIQRANVRKILSFEQNNESKRRWRKNQMKKIRNRTEKKSIRKKNWQHDGDQQQYHQQQ